jgi:hypothetical protein
MVSTPHDSSRPCLPPNMLRPALDRVPSQLIAVHDDIGRASTRSGPRRWIIRLADRLHAAEDARAQRRGWQITRTSGGMGREYRDPRWDLIAACEDCGGEGEHGAHCCATCQGRGTVRLDQADQHPGGKS